MLTIFSALSESWSGPEHDHNNITITLYHLTRSDCHSSTDIITLYVCRDISPSALVVATLISRLRDGRPVGRLFSLWRLKLVSWGLSRCHELYWTHLFSLCLMVEMYDRNVKFGSMYVTRLIDEGVDYASDSNNAYINAFVK